MDNILITHFKAIDNAKNLLFNSVNEQQIQQAQNFLDAIKKQEKNLYVN